MVKLEVAAESVEVIADALQPAILPAGITVETIAQHLYRVRLPLDEDAQLLYASAEMEVLSDG